MRVRLPQDHELPLLDSERFEQGYEQVDLGASLVRVAENDAGEPCAFIGAQRVWRVEPLVLLSRFRQTAPRVAWMRAAYALGWAMDKLLLSDLAGRSGQNCYFAFIREKRFQRLAENVGLVRVFKRGRIYARLW